MDRVVSHVRRVGLASVALLSVGVGVGTIWVVARPDVIGHVPTWTLFGVVGLLVLPLAVVGALAMDRRAIAAQAPIDLEGDVGRSVIRLVDDAGVPVPMPTSTEVHGVPTPRPLTLAHAGASTHEDRASRHRHHRGGVTTQD